MQSRSIDQTISADRSTASRQVRPASLKGRRTARRRAGRSRAGRSRKPIKRPDGWAPTTARRKRRSASPDAATRGGPGPRQHDRGAGRARRQRTLPAMAQPLGRDPSRPFAALAVMKILAYRIQATAFGGLDKETLRGLRQPKGHRLASSDLHPFEARIATTREGTKLKAGSLLAREWNGRLERVMILDQGVAWNGETYGKPIASRQGDDRHKLERPSLLRLANGQVRAIRDGPSQVQGIATPLRPAPPQRRSKTAEPLWPDDLAGRRPRHEIGERQNDTALRHLHPRLDRAWPGAGVQLARQSKGGLGSLHQEPIPRGLEAGPHPLRRRWLLGRLDGQASAPEAP